MQPSMMLHVPPAGPPGKELGQAWGPANSLESAIVFQQTADAFLFLKSCLPMSASMTADTALTGGAMI